MTIKEIIICVLFSAGALLLALSADALQIGNYTDEDIAEAIYISEGGIMAKKPFGILSVPCYSYSHCKKICLNTIRNNYARWQKNSRGMTYMEYLASRYAPIGASNDPKGLNKNWLKNVMYHLKKRR